MEMTDGALADLFIDACDMYVYDGHQKFFSGEVKYKSQRITMRPVREALDNLDFLRRTPEPGVME